MPQFEYHCKNCEIIFEELFLEKSEAEKYAKECPCRQCKKPAERIASAASFTFKAPAGQTQGSGVHGQSGVHDLDYPTADKAVGRSAEKKWTVYNERKKARDKVRRASGTNAISQSGDKVKPLNKQQLDTREKAIKLFKKAKEQSGQGK